MAESPPRSIAQSAVCTMPTVGAPQLAPHSTTMLGRRRRRLLATTALCSSSSQAARQPASQTSFEGGQLRAFFSIIYLSIDRFFLFLCTHVPPFFRGRSVATLHPHTASLRHHSYFNWLYLYIIIIYYIESKPKQLAKQQQRARMRSCFGARTCFIFLAD